MLAALVLRKLIFGYQRFVSPGLHLFFGFGSGCRFEPSCSRYADDAIEKRGAWVGLILAGLRVIRCHPFSRAGYDPVPSGKIEGGS